MTAFVSSDSSSFPLGCAGDRRERVDAHVDHQLAPHEGRHVLFDVRLEPGAAKGLGKRGELLVPPVRHGDMCGPLAGVADAAGTQKRRALGGDPGRGPLRTERAADDLLVAQPVLEGEHDGVLVRQGRQIGPPPPRSRWTSRR